MLYLISNEEGTVKIYLYAKDPFEAKYQLLINKRENIRLKYFNDSNASIEYLNDMEVTQLFITGRKLNISLVFITQSHFAVPKNIRLNSIHNF